MSSSNDFVVRLILIWFPSSSKRWTCTLPYDAFKSFDLWQLQSSFVMSHRTEEKVSHKASEWKHFLEESPIWHSKSLNFKFSLKSLSAKQHSSKYNYWTLRFVSLQPKTFSKKKHFRSMKLLSGQWRSWWCSALETWNMCAKSNYTN